MTGVDHVDRQILAFIGAHRFVLEEQIEVFVTLDPGAVEERLSGLEDQRLVRRERLDARQMAFVRITSSGLQSIGSRLPAPGLDVVDYRHAVLTVWLWVLGWREKFGRAQRVLSVREMQSLDRAAQMRGESVSGFELSVSGGRVYPDVAMAFAWGKGSLHLVTWPHQRIDLDALFIGYRERPDVADAVMMLVDDPAVGHKVKAAADRQGLSEKVRIQWADGRGTARPRVGPSAA